MDIRNGLVKNLPLPILGLCLGIISLGNFFKSYSIIIELICGIIGITLILRILFKFIMYPDFLKENLNKPISIGVLGTLPMALMIFSTYIYPLNNIFALGLWFFTVMIQLSLILYFTFKFIPKIKITDIYTTYLITYVGVTVISITSTTYGLETFGFVFLIMGLINVFFLLVIITYRYFRFPIPVENKPLTVLYAAPTIVVVGYFSIIDNINFYFIFAIYLFTSLLYLFALYKIIEYSFKLEWKPNHASYTFPFVINATASQIIYQYMFNLNLDFVNILFYFFIFQIVVATFFVIYESIKIIQFVYFYK